jgi:ribonuclease E
MTEEIAAAPTTGTPAAAEGTGAAGTTGAPRRRSRRGGRGRSRGRGSGTGSANGSAVTKTAAPAKDTEPKEPAVKGTAGAQAASGEATPAKRRRRRGGRGRGKKGAGTGSAATGSTSTEAAGPAAASKTADAGSKADEPAAAGAPNGAPAKRRRRRRRSSGAGKEAAATAGDKPASRTEGAAAPGEKAASQAKPRMSLEDQVAAGGPTRGLRSTRSRAGREGSGRRRREPVIIPPRVTDKLMVITEHGDRDQIAVLEGDLLVQHYVTRTGAKSMVGNVYLGRVQNVLPGMEAAFVDVGRGRNGVLYAGEVNYRPEDLEGPAPRIEQVLKNGQAVMVQVTKDPMGGKGARLTAQISMPGRYLVLAPDQELSGISRRLPDDERKRLKAILKKIKPAEHGVIVRTAAEGASEEALTADLERLVRGWNDIQKLAKKVKAPEVLYEEPELTVRVVRDLFTDEEFRGLVTDSPRVYEQVMAYVRDIAPDLEAKVTLHQGRLPAFEEHRIVEQIHKALDKKVWLPSGGYLFIERTEAMTIIDVNTGKSVGKTNLEETVVNTNVEASKEVARQLRLRDIGGIIVIDFIDMLLEKNKKLVEDTMKEALAVDKTRSQVFEIGALGLMQVTRKRVSGGLVESFSETCPTCEGRGILINYET